MSPDAVLAELEKLAASCGADVSYESLRSAVGVGGLCRVKGEYRIIIAKRAGTNERIGALASGVAQLETESVEMSPSVRELLDQYTRTHVLRAS